jgi:glyoxylase-like metal-dependent hydrolase (beta-lactamase superfamily II)
MGPEQIAEGVFLVGGPNLTSPDDCCIYLVDLGSPTLIDAGAGTNIKALLANIEEAGYTPHQLKALVLTHCHIDHVGGAFHFVEKYKLPVYIHELDAEVLEGGDTLRSAANWYGVGLKPLAIRNKLKGREGVIPGGYSPLNWIHTPGHTPGSISLWAKAGIYKVLFAQDVHGPFYEIFGSNLDDWAASMRGLIELEPDILCEGHFGIYRPASEARKYIEDYLKNYNKL